MVTSGSLRSGLVTLHRLNDGYKHVTLYLDNKCPHSDLVS